MTVKEHYDNHLGNFYCWMAGDFDTKTREFEQWLKAQAIAPQYSGNAIDLGAGHGIQSVALARLGFNVKAIDFNPQLLCELRHHGKGYNIKVIEGNLKDVVACANPAPELILCWGDTLTHLNSLHEIKDLLANCVDILADNGKLIISFRDYTHELTGTSRFIPVKSDEYRILTCFLEYHPEHVTVTDLLYENVDRGWTQKVSAYRKVRIDANVISDYLVSLGMKITCKVQLSGAETIIAEA